MLVICTSSSGLAASHQRNQLSMASALPVVVVRKNRFFLTTTTGNADAIDSWFRWWLAAKPELDVQMTNISGSYAAMNLAGPKAREILAKLTDADLSTQAMPYLAAAQCAVAGVQAII